MRRLSILLTLIALLFVVLPASAQSGSAESDSPARVRKVESLNKGLPKFHSTALKSLTTPEQALTYFVKKCKAGSYQEAAQVLNLSMIAPKDQASVGADLARKLYVVMKRRTGFPFEKLPDREDGRVPYSSSQSSGPEYRGAFLLGTLPLETGQFEIHLVHYRTGDLDSAWLFSHVTVDEIQEAYERMGPRDWEKNIPTWFTEHSLVGAPVWAWFLLILTLAVAAGTAKLTLVFAQRFLRFDLISKLRKGLFVLLVCWIPYLSLGFWAPIPALVRYTLLFFGFCALVWLTSATLNYFSMRLIRGELESVEDLDGAGRQEDKHTLTYLSVGRRLLSFLVLAVGLGVIALKIPTFQSIGVGLLASAGVLSVLLGVAAQPILGNLIAGLQIGITRPIRIGDSIIYEGTWCYVEDVTFMYVMCRTWDEMRLVIPLRYFANNPFKSDSLSDPRTMRTVEMKLDYNTDVQALREEYLRMVESAEDWDKDHDPQFEVISFNDETITIRAVAWSANASTAWRLHCEFRERLLEYLQREQPEALPRKRLVGTTDDKTTPEAETASPRKAPQVGRA